MGWFGSKNKSVGLDVDKLLSSKDNILFRLSPSAAIYLDGLRDPKDIFPSDLAFHKGSLVDSDHSKYYGEKTRCLVLNIPGKTKMAFTYVGDDFTYLGVYEAQIHATHEFKVDGVSTFFEADYAAINTTLNFDDEYMDYCKEFISQNCERVYGEAIFQHYGRK